MGQAKLFNGCLPQILIGPLLNTLPQRKQSYHAPFFKDRESIEKLYFQGKSGNLKVAVTRKQSTPNFPKNEHFLPPDTLKKFKLIQKYENQSI